MREKGNHVWSVALRTLLVPLFAYLLIIQSVLFPASRASAIEAAALDRALAVICLTDSVTPADQENNVPVEHAHDLGCCTLGQRSLLDSPVAILAASSTGIVQLVRSEMKPVYATDQHRLRARTSATPLQPRAPPSLI
jgi:hypothetical protein